MNVPDKATFASIYAGQPPWDIGKPQKLFIEVADRINGSVLDAGCGTGDNAIVLRWSWPQSHRLRLPGRANPSRPSSKQRIVLLNVTFLVKRMP